MKPPKSRVRTSFELFCAALITLVHGMRVEEAHSKTRQRSVRNPQMQADVNLLRRVRYACRLSATQLATELGTKYFFLPGGSASTGDYHLQPEQWTRVAKLARTAGLEDDAIAAERRACDERESSL